MHFYRIQYSGIKRHRNNDILKKLNFNGLNTLNDICTPLKKRVKIFYNY